MVLGDRSAIPEETVTNRTGVGRERARSLLPEEDRSSYRQDRPSASDNIQAFKDLIAEQFGVTSERVKIAVEL